jgi:signal transduction histidine kinase
MPTFRLFEAAIFRRTLAIAGLFIATNLLLFVFIYWQTAILETRRIMDFLERQAPVLAQASSTQIRQSLQRSDYDDVHRLTISGLFEEDGAFLEGRLGRIPDGLAPDGVARKVDQTVLADGSTSEEAIVLVARRLSDQRILVVGRNVQELANLQATVGKALQLGVAPMAALAVAVGAILSLRMNQRLRHAQQTLADIQKGQLHRRLAVSDARDDLDRLAEAVNAMLGELEHAINELHHVGNNIAHDLRTPLSRVRAHLERLQRMLAGQQEPQELLDRAISGLDQTFAITTAMLRIAQIETGRARASFCVVDLAEILREVSDLYGPLAEAKQISSELHIRVEATVEGDRDLLLEALANLVDNAIKFTPEGGRIELALARSTSGPIVTVRDNGPGVAQSQREDVFKRFYRCNQSRHVAGSGLGLALVAAIVRLHGFSIEIEDAAPGCAFEMKCFSSDGGHS